MTSEKPEAISGWGRYPIVESLVSSPDDFDEILSGQDTLICRGQGRSYGDAAVSSHGRVILTAHLGRLCQFDRTTGVVRAEAGMTIGDLLAHAVPLGWFVPVTPGTKHVSLGGAVAADVHGKNHHRDGSIGNHVIELELIVGDGSRLQCGPRRNSELFWATVGGMGLTGIIATVTLQLMPIETSSISAQHFKAPDLETMFRWLQDSEHDDQYSVAWVDCLSRGRHFGRGILIRGHHAGRDELAAGPPSVRARRAIPVPIEFRTCLVNPLSARLFNALYYAVKGWKNDPFLVDYDRFFYPLDRVGNWNRLYGKPGFLQYQFMIPGEHAHDGVRRIFERLISHQRGVYLAVLKRLGPANPAPMSFPDRGYTLALDLPMTGDDLLKRLDEIDDMVLESGGRVYLAKDARLAPERFRRMYPRLNEWLHVKSTVDPCGRFRSDMSSRLGIDRLAADAREPALRAGVTCA